MLRLLDFARALNRANAVISLLLAVIVIISGTSYLVSFILAVIAYNVLELRRLGVKRRFQEEFVVGATTLMDRASDQINAKKWTREKRVELYSGVPEEQLATGAIFEEYASLWTLHYASTKAQRKEINRLQAIVNEERPLSKEIVAGVTKKLGIFLNNSSNAIEGLDMSLRETEMVLANEELFAFKPREVVDVVGHQKAFVHVLKIAQSQEDITVDDILAIHSFVLFFDQNLAGRFRASNELAIIRGRKILTAHPLEVPKLMQELVIRMNSKECSILDKLVNVHVQFIRIHPFADGNGRTIRLLCCLLSLRAGCGAFYIDKSLKGEYMNAITLWEDHKNTKAMGDLFYKQMVQILNIYVSSIHTKYVII